MSTTNPTDEEALRVAVASVRRHSMDISEWKHTVIGELHPKLASVCHLAQGEFPIVSAFFSSESWYVVTTRRLLSRHAGSSFELDPRYGIDSSFGNFKGIKRSEAPAAPSTEVALVTSKRDGTVVRFEFETGKPSMAPIYACMFWSRVSRFHHDAAKRDA